MILAWGADDDATLASVVEALERRRAPVVWLDDLPRRLALEPGVPPTGTLRLDRATVPLDAVTAVYLRPEPAPADSPDVLGDVACWLDLTEAYVLNRPSAMASNGSKPYQLALVAAAGFAVPETLVTTSPDDVTAFAARHGELVYKSTSGVRSRVSVLSGTGRLASVTACPTQFQRRVPGTDVRVHVVGGDVIATEVRSDAPDYRYPAGGRTELVPGRLPGDVAARCVRLARTLGLPLAGVDLRRGDDGRWYCFEVNPSPAFSYYEDATGQPVADAVAALLASAAR